MARTLRDEHTDLPVGFVSGYMGSAASLRAQGLENTAFLTKPFLPQTLLEHLGALMAPAEPD